MLASAVSALQRHGFAELLQKRDALGRELASVKRQWSEVRQRIPLWDRVVFFHDTEDEALASTLAEQLEDLEGRHHAAEWKVNEAAVQIFAESPPVEIAYRVEQVIFAVFNDTNVGLRGGADEPLAAELEDIAARIVDLWVPGFDTTVFGRVLADPATRVRAASMDPGPLREDATLGFASISPDELGIRAARALASEAFNQAQAAVAKEASDHQQVAQHLEAAREQVSTFDRLSPGKGPAEQAVSALEKALESEYGEYVAAVETFHLLIEHAVTAFPPMGVYFAALGASGAIRSADPVAEGGITPDGGLGTRPGFAARAMILATLIPLRNALDEAFPGLGHLVSTRSSRRSGPHDAGPYREAPPSESDQAAVKAVSPDDAVLDSLEGHGLRPVVMRGVSHASMLGSVARAFKGISGKIGWSDRLAVWSQSEDKFAEARLRERETWHRTMFHWVCSQGTHIVDGACRQSPRHALGLGLVAAHQAWSRISTQEGTSSSPMTCPAYGKREMLNALDYARSCIEHGFGPRGDRDYLVQAIVAHLHRAPVASPVHRGAPARVLGWEEIVAAIAESLRPHGFLPLHQRVTALRSEYAHLSHDALRARAAVSLWDKLNVFTDTPAEKLRDELQARTQQTFQALQRDESQANSLLNHALWVYPPAAIYYEVFRVVDAASAIQAVRHRGTSTSKVGNTTVTRTYYYCRLHGKEAAGQALQQWTRNVIHCFGYIPSPSELMARWVGRELGIS